MFKIGRVFPKLPLILQDQLSECGHACVAMVASFWGQGVDLARVRTLMPPHLHGVSLREISQMFSQLGFETRALQVSLSDLSLVKCPALLHWNMNHFVVLKKATAKYMIIHDPAIGVRRVLQREASLSFTGIVLEIEKSANFQITHHRSRFTLWDWAKHIQGFKPWVTVLFILSMVIELLHLSSPLFTQYVTDQVISTSNIKNLSVISLGFLTMILISAFSERIRAHLVLYLKMQMTEQFSLGVMRHLFRLPLSFFEARHKGDLQSKVRAVGDIQRKMSIDFMTTILDGVMIMLQYAMMLLYSARLAGVVFVALVCCVSVRVLSYRLLKDKTTLSIHQHAKADSLFLESLQTMLPIKTYLKESLRLNAWRNHWVSALNQDLAVEGLQAHYQVMNQLVTQVEYLIVVAGGAVMVLEGSLTVGMLLAFVGLRQQLVQKCFSLIHQVFEYRLLAIQLDRLNDIMTHPPELSTQQPKAILKSVRGEIILRGISFAYNPVLPPLISQFDLHIQAGEKVVLVGPSGCGKTTLLKIMMGLLEPTAGQVLVDGLSINDIGVRSYRALIASVMQEDALLCGSLLDNITFFEEIADLEDVYHAAKLACIDTFIQQLPMGYETRVGDMGSSLSGGQKQRILLARALYKKPKILFLDEATSHLDAYNEHQMNQALKSFHITQVMVAHRQETIATADRVISLI